MCVWECSPPPPVLTKSGIYIQNQLLLFQIQHIEKMLEILLHAGYVSLYRSAYSTASARMVQEDTVQSGDQAAQPGIQANAQPSLPWACTSGVGGNPVSSLLHAIIAATTTTW